MKSYNHKPNTNSFVNNHKISNTNGFLPYSLKFISSCIKTASSGVRSASASVAASISSGAGHEHKDQVLWCSFDAIELGPSSFKRVLLLGYSNGFQVLDVEDASNVSELVSKRDDPVTFLQMQPLPVKSKGCEGFRASHPLLLVVASDESKSSSVTQNGREGLPRDGSEAQIENLVLSSTAVRFYSLRSHNYVHLLRFRSTVHMVRCSPHIVAVGLSAQIYCFDALTLENKFSVLTYPMLQLGGQGCSGVNIGYGPMDVGARWLAYAPNNPLSSNTGRLSPKSLTPPGVSPSTSPSNGSLMARYAMESSKQLASGLINLSDMGYKTLSRYYQELIPDGASSPIPSNSSGKGVRSQTHSTDPDTAGVVVVKDFVSRAIISQFKAHSSPISTLCFDPSGTLLLTASVHGNNINIFRIMPRCSKPGSSQNNDWSSSHVHLYKLHRGVTSAVIQDICFSHYSQWVAIITAKGTCHIFLLSPFGGEAALQIHNSDVGQPTLLPVLSLPWWSTPSFMTNQQSSSQCLPPPPVTTYVTSRIKNSNSGWLNSVSNVASSANGKISAPSGAAAAVFHSLALHNPQSSLAKVNPLEHLLVYTPTGHIVQYELLPSMGLESSTNVSRTLLSTPAQVQDEDLRVKVEPLQWWDVCRRTDWPEREECVSGLTFDKDTSDAIMVGSGSEENHAGDREVEASYERSHFYLANAEVQMSFGRTPVWQQSKISFYTINSLSLDEVALADGSTSGELEIENFRDNEVEIRRKNLLPVFNHFQKNRFDWSKRGHTEGKGISFVSDMALEKPSGDGMIAYPQLDSSLQNSNGSLENYISPITRSGNETNNQRRVHINNTASPVLKQASPSPFTSTEQQQQGAYSSPIDAFNVPNRPLTYLSSSPHNADRITSDELKPLDSSAGSSSNIIEEHIVHDSLDFEHYFQEGYCQPPPNANGCQDPVEEANVDTDGNSSPCQDKSEEDDDNDDMLGGVFDFSEEG